MYDVLVAKTIRVLAPRMGCAPGSLIYDKLWYGIYIFYINIIKTAGLLVIAYILGIVPYVLLFMLALGALRLYSFGVHVKSSFLCTLIGLAVTLSSTYISLHVNIPIALKIPILLACVVSFVAYAPAQTKKRPIPEKQRNPFRKKSLYLLTTVIFMVFIFYPFPAVSNLLFIAAVCQAVNILPATYKILKEE